MHISDNSEKAIKEKEMILSKWLINLGFYD